LLLISRASEHHVRTDDGHRPWAEKSRPLLAADDFDSARVRALGDPKPDLIGGISRGEYELVIERRETVGALSPEILRGRQYIVGARGRAIGNIKHIFAGRIHCGVIKSRHARAPIGNPEATLGIRDGVVPGISTQCARTVRIVRSAGRSETTRIRNLREC